MLGLAVSIARRLARSDAAEPRGGGLAGRARDLVLGALAPVVAVAWIAYLVCGSRLLALAAGAPPDPGPRRTPRPGGGD